MKSFTMYIEKPMSYHERLFRAEGYTTNDIDKLVIEMADKGFIKADDLYAREIACVAEMVKLKVCKYMDVD